MGNCLVCAGAPSCWLWCCCIGSGHQYAEFDQEDYKGSKPSCWPWAPTALYTLDPSSQESLELDARVLFKAMKGLGTRDSDLVRVLSNRTPEQLRRIAIIFTENHGNGTSLAEWIKGDTSGDFEKVLLACLHDQGATDAKVVNDSIAGLGTEDTKLRDILTTRSTAALRKMRTEYSKLYSKDVDMDIKEDTSGDYEKTLLALMNKSEYLARRIHSAIEGLGTEDTKLIILLTGINRQATGLREVVANFEDTQRLGLQDELEYDLSLPTMEEVKTAYKTLYGVSLAEDVSRDTSGHYEQCLLQLIRSPEENLANALHLAFEGIGTEDQMLIGLMTCHSNREIVAAGKIYREKFGKTLEERIKGETTGNYESTLLDLAMPRHERIAIALHKSMQGLGTEDTRLIAQITSQSRAEIRQICAAFETKYQKSLQSALEGDCSWMYKRTLIYIIRQSHNDLHYVGKGQLKRVHDM